MSLKNALTKKWQRITESRYTKGYVVIAIIQFIILVTLQVRMLYRNLVSYLDEIVPFVNETTTPSCKMEDITVTYIVLSMEDVIFIFFNSYQLYFCLNAVSLQFF